MVLKLSLQWYRTLILTFLFKNAVRQWQLQGCEKYLTVDQNGISL